MYQIFYPEPSGLSLMVCVHKLADPSISSSINFKSILGSQSIFGQVFSGHLGQVEHVIARQLILGQTSFGHLGAGSMASS